MLEAVRLKVWIQVPQHRRTVQHVRGKHVKASLTQNTFRTAYAQLMRARKQTPPADAHPS